MEALLTMLLSERTAAMASTGEGRPPSAEAERLRKDIRQSLTKDRSGAPATSLPA
jgi:hypothetical protein